MTVIAMLIAAAMVLGQINAVSGRNFSPYHRRWLSNFKIGPLKLPSVAVDAATVDRNAQAPRPAFNTICRLVGTLSSSEIDVAAATLSATPAAR